MKRSEIEDRIAKTLSIARKYVEESALRAAGLFFLAGIVVALFLRFFVSFFFIAMVALICVWLIAEKDNNLPSNTINGSNGGDRTNA